MGKTTIDGLAVRSSKKTPRSNTSRQNRTPRKSLDMTTNPRKAVPTKTQNQTQRPVPSERRKPAVCDDDFLGTVDSFSFDEFSNEPEESDYEAAERETLGSDTGADWSELLGELSSAKRTDTDDFNEATGADWLADWGGEADDKEELEPEPRKTHCEKKQKRFPKVRFAICLVLLLLLAGGGVVYFWGDALIARLTGGNSGLIDAIQSMISNEVPFETDENGRTNVLIFGTEGYNMNGETAYGEHDGAQLTDSIMVASFDQETNDVALISIPRDLKVTMACSAGKINEVFWCHNQDGNDENAGAKALMSQIEQVLGIDFQYYAHVNWGSLVSIVDTIGGVTVTLDEDIADYSYTGMVVQAGVPTEMNGEQALGLARARHGTMGGDFTRGNTQQKIVAAIAQKLVSNGVGITDGLNLLNILGDNLRTNFSTDNIKAGIRLLTNVDMSKIRSVSLVDYQNGVYYLTTTTINDISYVIPAAGERDYTQIQQLVAESLDNNPVVQEHAKLAVYNATGLVGIASGEKERLENDKFAVTEVGNAEPEDCYEQYCLYALNPEMGATKAALETRYGVTARSMEELPGDIWPNDADFIVVVGEKEETV